MSVVNSLTRRCVIAVEQKKKEEKSCQRDGSRRLMPQFYSFVVHQKRSHPLLFHPSRHIIPVLTMARVFPFQR